MAASYAQHTKQGIHKLSRRKLLALYFSSNRQALSQELAHCFSSPFGPGRITAYSPSKADKTLKQQQEAKEEQVLNQWSPSTYIVPHGAFCDAGPITAHAFHHLYHNLRDFYTQHSKLPSTVIVIGTNHRYIGERISTSSQVWSTPFGDIRPNLDIINELNTKYNICTNHNAHSKEHSIENQLPFIQYVYSQFPGHNEFMLVPILVSYCKGIEEAQQYAMHLVNCLKSVKLNLSDDIVLIGTTDFTHAGPGYNELPPSSSNLNLLIYTRRQDKCVIDSILSKEKDDMKWMQSILKSQQQCRNSMCGLWSMILTMLCSKCMGLNDIKLMKYAVSSEVLFRPDVTGFASFVLQ